MAKIGTALMLIFIGTGLFLKSLGLVPENFYSIYLAWVDRYWPLLLVLAGIKIIINTRWKAAGDVIRWVIFILVALWIVSLIWGDQQWII